ncbi:IS3 family transposase, partial [Salinimicrobium sp. CDJ15-91]|nr:IS3 family transposase [Salinimicrobium oceani]
HRLMKLMSEADDIRRDHPGCGVEKMYYTLKPDFIGRDRFVETFMQLGYRLKRKKNYRRTTIAGKIYYPNKIKGIEINAPSVVWQSDITYYKVGDKFYYAVFIID